MVKYSGIASYRIILHRSVTVVRLGIVSLLGGVSVSVYLCFQLRPARLYNSPLLLNFCTVRHKTISYLPHLFFFFCPPSPVLPPSLGPPPLLLHARFSLSGIQEGTSVNSLCFDEPSEDKSLKFSLIRQKHYTQSTPSRPPGKVKNTTTINSIL